MDLVVLCYGLARRLPDFERYGLAPEVVGRYVEVDGWRFDKGDRVLPEQCGNEYSRRRNAYGDPNRSPDDQSRPQTLEEGNSHPSRYPSPRKVLMAPRPNLRRSRAT